MTAMIQGHETGIMRALSALAIAAFIALAITVLPGFAPNVAAGVPFAMAKADKLLVIGGTCAEQSWPNLSASCLRRTDATPVSSNVRVVTAERP